MAKADSRAHILDHGLELVSREGLYSVTIGGLAKHVGMSKSGLYAHFESKEMLQIALLDRAAELLLEIVVAPALEGPRGEPRIRALFENWLWWAGGEVLPGGCVFVAAAAEYDDRPGPVRDRLLSAQRDWIESLANAARGAVHDGQYRADLDCGGFAFEVYGILLAHHLHARLLGDPRSSQWAREAFSSLCHGARLRH